ncbi:protein Hook homolog 3 [Neodiprion pinetum]|uniref:Protein hook n=1 Tax=Neodiprion lecontei TaxID=441921 RepID=A0A6J0BX41_NEOLC|nr:protein Hook homolog 3 [Neodiprion lecontei]XP_046433486.1 protein Hook homolog 3 [Neodiprion fabricii]XP_046491690.1 protein Hook homolog 3 [Neodiprion pinetum]XP_046629200.1 protein Hook homolog 3 [Neodiprion virginianus]
MNNQQLGSLIKWLDTFELQAAHSTPEDISDGVAMAEALAQIAPEWFTAVWRSKIKTEVSSNWRLKVSNLKKIIEAVTEYYVECLNQQLSGYVKPDATKIGEHCDHNELRRLLQLILGCAVNCNQKQQYITRIMGMEEVVQQVIMQSIQELEGCMQGPRLSLGASLNFESLDFGDGTQQRLLVELQAAIDSRDQLAQRCHELDQQLSLLQEEKAGLIAETKKLQERLDEFENPEDSGSSLKYSGLRKQLESLKDEMFKMESSRDDYRLKVELLEKEVLDLHSKQEDLQKAADKANHLKDEVDALRETADKVTKYELTIESYKKKMEDLSDLRRQVKILEDKNMEYVQANMEYEEEAKRASMLRNHLELCKKQLAEVNRKLDEESNKSDKLQFESKKMEAKLNAVQRERDRLIIERDALKENNEELKCTQLQAAENSAKPSDVDAVENTEMIPPEVKEKLLRLQHENKMLKLTQKGTEDKVPSVQALLDDSAEILNTLRGQNRKANQRIIELENQLEEVKESQVGGESKGDSAGLQKKINQLMEEVRRLQIECERLNVQQEEREATIQSQKQKIFTLQESLTRKECENAALDDRHKKYVEKAKNVLKSLELKPIASSSSELLMLRNQVMEKQKIIEEMEKSYKENKLLKEMEEKLMVTAFHRLGFACHKEAVDQHLAALGAGQGQSFLARQRQPSARKAFHPSYNSK